MKRENNISINDQNDTYISKTNGIGQSWTKTNYRFIEIQ